MCSFLFKRFCLFSKILKQLLTKISLKTKRLMSTERTKAHNPAHNAIAKFDLGLFHARDI